MTPEKPLLFDPLSRLRLSTADLHISLDRHSHMSRLLAEDLALDEYAAILRRLLACHLEFEPVIDDFRKGLAQSPDWLTPSIYQRSADLVADLQSLGDRASLHENKHNTRGGNEPPLEVRSQAQAAGFMYVLAGAGLGARLIHRRLREQLGEQVAPALRYFSPPADARAWPAYRKALNVSLCRTEEEAAAIQGARALFNCFLRHMQIESAPLRATESPPPTVLMSANVRVDDAEVLVRTDFVAVLRKPVDPD